MLKVVNDRVITEMDDEQEYEDNNLLEPALGVLDEVEDHSFDLDVPPTTGSEYLRRVR